jgi:DNA helicase-2/ATP-dependent DNA helicase PcrA
MPERSTGDPRSTHLNEAQLAAVRAVDGPQLIVAGAGTGKTRTLVHRVAHLVETGVAPESILLLTFTRRAAREMLERASRLLDERCHRVAGGTFHSFANLVLRRWGSQLGYDREFTILDRGDSASLLGALRAELGLDRRERRFPRKETLADLFSKRINTHRKLETLLEDEYPHFLDDLDALRDLEQRYRERKRQQNVMDYDDLLVNLRDLLVEHSEVRQRLGSSYRYIMVDEYQDTNRLQAHIAALLASVHGNLTVVGDDAQSIYSFRGANFRNIMDFRDIFPDCRTTLLEQNYRSTQPVLDLGNRILEAAREKFDKHLFTRVEGERKPVFVRTPDDHDQAVFICERVLAAREEGTPLAEIAILSRAAWHTNTLEVELRSRNIPFRKFGGIRFVEAAHVKDVCAMLRIALNPLDSTSWMRALQLLEGVGDRRALQMTELVLRARGETENAFTTHFRAGRYGKALRRLCDTVAAAADDAAPLSERIDGVLDFYRPLLERNYDDARRRRRDLDALSTLAARYESLDRLLSDIAIEAPEFGRDPEERDQEDEWVTVSTIHSAKGLEWDTVFVANLINGQFPVAASSNDADDYEEERRLLYVAVTRCRRELYLMKPEIVPGRGWMAGVGELSPLITEIEGFAELTESLSFSQRAEELASDDTVVVTGGDRLSRIQSYFDGGD